ncbi:DNA polymerase III subunit delta' [Lysobacter humi (ex Lee et al. 2017)]
MTAPWERRAYEGLVAAHSAGRLGHAQLIHGPARLGKRRVAERFANYLLCDAPGGVDPCGACRSCRQFAQRHQRDPQETRPDGSLAHPDGHPGHPDALFIGYVLNEKSSPKKMRSEIVIDQMRELTQQLLITPQYGRARVALVEPADAIGTAAANALLKTLEEPVPGRYLLLVTSQPARLPATIRSRCQRVEFRLPPADEARAWLAAQGHAAADADEALTASRGHPGLADDWLRNGGLELRRGVGRDLQRLARGEASVQEVTGQWADVQAAERVAHAADLVAQKAAGLTDPRTARSLAAWFDKANRSRDLLRTTVRSDLVLMELLMAWRDTARTGPETRER